MNLLTFACRKNSLDQFFDCVIVDGVCIDVATEFMEVTPLDQYSLNDRFICINIL